MRIEFQVIAPFFSFLFLLNLAYGCSSDVPPYLYDYSTDRPWDQGSLPDSYDQVDEPPVYEVYEAIDTFGMDLDGDGWSPATGDCNESLAHVNPGAFDHPGNRINDDCHGGVDDPLSRCDCTGTDDLTAGIDLCDPRWLVSWNRVSYTIRGRVEGAGVRTHYGSHGNGLTVRQGCAYTILATGAVDLERSDYGRQPGTDFYGDPFTGIPCQGWEPDPNPAGPDGNIICDTQQLVLNLRAPTNANGFSFDFIYLSTEYPEWVDQGFNDTFYAILSNPLTGEVRNISFDNFGNEIEVDTAFFENPPVTDITGTGYEGLCEYSWDEMGEVVELSPCGSSTGWLRTSWNIQPGQEFTLTFSIHDEGDGIYDSAVIIDNFQWSAVPVEEGTTPLI